MKRDTDIMQKYGFTEDTCVKGATFVCVESTPHKDGPYQKFTVGELVTITDTFKNALGRSRMIEYNGGTLTGTDGFVNWLSLSGCNNETSSYALVEVNKLTDEELFTLRMTGDFELGVGYD